MSKGAFFKPRIITLAVSVFSQTVNLVSPTASKLGASLSFCYLTGGGSFENLVDFGYFSRNELSEVAGSETSAN